MKRWVIRMPDELYEWLIQKAGMETAKRKERVSLNGITLEVLTRAMGTDLKRKGKKQATITG